MVQKGGSSIIEEANEILAKRINIPTGAVAVTGAGELNTKHLIHAVGPDKNSECQRGIN